MLSTARRLQALGTRHYARRPPAPVPALLDSAAALLARQPAGPAEWHAHLRAVRGLITDLHPPEWGQHSWRAWTAQLRLWRAWMDGVRALHDLGALGPSRRASPELGEGPGSDLRRLKADDFTPLFLALVHQPRVLAGKLAQHGRPRALAALGLPDVLRLMFDLGLAPTPFQLTLLLQAVPLDELLARGTAPPSASSSSSAIPPSDPGPSTPANSEAALDRAAAALRPMLAPVDFDAPGMRRRRGVRHHEVEYAKLLLDAAHQCLRALEAGAAEPQAATYEAALERLRPYWQEHLRALVAKVAGRQLGAAAPESPAARVSATEAFAAKLQIMDTLRSGTGPQYRLAGGVLDLADPVETLKLLAAAAAAPPPPLRNPFIPARPAAKAETAHPLAGRAGAMLAAWAPRLAPPPAEGRFAAEAVSSLIRLAHHAARNKDFRLTLRLADVAAGFGIPARTGMYLAGAAQAPEDLARMLPKLQRLRVAPQPDGRKKSRRGVRRLRLMARDLDRSEKSTSGDAEGRGRDETPDDTRKRRTYRDQLEEVLARWAVV